jgi:hypothetical protein
MMIAVKKGQTIEEVGRGERKEERRKKMKIAGKRRRQRTPFMSVSQSMDEKSTEQLAAN